MEILGGPANEGSKAAVNLQIVRVSVLFHAPKDQPTSRASCLSGQGSLMCAFQWCCVVAVGAGFGVLVMIVIYSPADRLQCFCLPLQVGCPLYQGCGQVLISGVL